MHKITTYDLALKVKAMRLAQHNYFELFEVRNKSDRQRMMFNEARSIANKMGKEVDELVNETLLADPNEANRLQLAGLLIGEALTIFNALDTEHEPLFRPALPIGDLLNKAIAICNGKEVSA